MLISVLLLVIKLQFPVCGNYCYPIIIVPSPLEGNI